MKNYLYEENIMKEEMKFIFIKIKINWLFSKF